MLSKQSHMPAGSAEANQLVPCDNDVIAWRLHVKELPAFSLE